jgi:hypothetical protein
MITIKELRKVERQVMEAEDGIDITECAHEVLVFICTKYRNASASAMAKALGLVIEWYALEQLGAACIREFVDVSKEV